MGIWDWIVIIARIIIIIAGGASKAEAVSQASREFGVPEEEIWKHGGF